MSAATERYGIVADVHSNLQALETVLAYLDEREVDAIWCLGDVVGYGGDPVRCVALVRERCVVTVRGNHDVAAIDERLRAWFNPHARAAIERQAELLGDGDREWLAGLPATHQMDHAAITHSGFDDPDAFDYIMFAHQAGREIRAMTGDVGFFGHTHVPAGYRQVPEGSVRAFRLVEGENRLTGAGRFLVNPGAVGQPRDGDPRAACAIWEPASATIVHARLEYDIDAAQAAIQRAGMPPFEAARLARGM